ncbi:hypothetical protein DERP_001110 [Dermatophagoides pteronyssinus]|uniref:Rab proteins geranylgeranyltransferase component A n=1 Tax=Dermatophagoides pteronyssinus TaxID=6956 RepID=A0ABQ8JDJ5_DERPT|nr:hypothetical protein DERP_001110 [Dermatophagoides pteronyssinus]
MNNKNEFDQHYEVVLTGTDFISSLLSAAFARIGKKVLHLDCEKHYGKEWRSMKFTDLLLWMIRCRTLQSSTLEQSKDDEIPPLDSSTKDHFIAMNRTNPFSNVEIDFFLFDDLVQYKKFFEHLFKTKCTTEFLDEFMSQCIQKLQNVQTYDEACQLLEEFKDGHPLIHRLDNMFTFDLCPRFLIANEKLVKLLIDSTVTRYIEFKKISRLLTAMTVPQTDDKMRKSNNSEDVKMEIVEVPCTRNDIFISNIISPIEKRYLMSFLEKCYRLERHGDWYREFSDRPFSEFLKTQTLTDKLQEFITNTLLMQSQQIQTENALNKIHFFLRSFGRFCDRPFLFPLYGSEDIIQAFCRYGAVWGGLYCLGVSIHGIIIDKKDEHSKKQCKSIMVNRSLIECDNLITDYRFVDIQPIQLKEQKILARAIILNTKSIKAIDPENELGDLSFIHLPPKFTGLDSSVYCFETDYSSRVCPRHFYLQYFWCDSSSDRTPKQVLEPVIKKLLSLDRETQTSDLPFELQGKILLSVYYNYCSEIYDNNNEDMPTNIKFISMPINEFNYENAVAEAEKIFKELYPNEEFFPLTEKPDENQQLDDDGDKIDDDDEQDNDSMES